MSKYLKENCNTTLSSLYNKDQETVLKLSLNTKAEYKIKSRKSRTTETDLIALHHSIQRIKKIMPSIMTIMKKSVREEKTEDIIYQRFEHIDIENDIKHEIEDINKQIKEKKDEINLLLNKIKLIDNEINNIELDINLLIHPEKYTLIEKEKTEIIKEINEKEESIKNAKIAKRKLRKKQLSENINNENKDLKEKEREKEKEKEDNSESNIQNKTRFNNIAEFELFLYKKKKENETEAKEKEELLTPKLDEKRKLDEEINQKSVQIDNLKHTKSILIDKLYYHYLKLLKEGKDTRNEGLSWIIKEIYLLGRTVIMSYLPNYLDKNAIDFIFDQAHFSLKIKELNDKLLESREILGKSGIRQVANKLSSIRGMHEKKNEHIYLTEKRKFDDYSTYSRIHDKNSILKCKNIIELIAIPPVIKLKDLEVLLEKSGHMITHSQMVILVDYLNILDKRDQMKEFQREMRQREMDRIFNEYLRNNYQNRYNVEKNVVLSALIGEDNINTELNKQLKRTKQYLDQLKKIGMGKNNDAFAININVQHLKEISKSKKD